MRQKHVLIMLLLIASSFVNGQEKVYYDVDANITKDINLATHYTITLESTKGRYSLFNETDYYISGQKKAVRSYIVKDKNGKSIDSKLIGEKLEWFENGDVKLKAYYKDGKLNGEFYTYWPSGIQRRKDIFKKDKLIEGNCYDSIGNKLPNYFPYETFPEFPGGGDNLFKFFREEIKYPVEAQENGIQGRVVIQFYVETDGRISDIRIVEKVNNYLDDEAYRLISSMPKWTSGTREGQKIRFKVTHPIRFRLQ